MAAAELGGFGLADGRQQLLALGAAQIEHAAHVDRHHGVEVEGDGIRRFGLGDHDMLRPQPGDQVAAGRVGVGARDRNAPAQQRDDPAPFISSWQGSRLMVGSPNSRATSTETGAR